MFRMSSLGRMAAAKYAGAAAVASYPTFDTAVTPGWFDFTAGDLTVTAGGVAAAQAGHTRLTGDGKLTGKWYIEFVLNAKNTGNNDRGGVGMVSAAMPQGIFFGNNNVSHDDNLVYAWNGWTGINIANTYAFTAYRTAQVATNVIGMAVDLTAKKVWFSLNGVWQGGGDPAAATSPTITWAAAHPTMWPGVCLDEAASGTRPSYSVRTNPTNFSYAVPSGFAAYA